MKKLAIIGRPNVGKSSFFNRLLKQRDAITSEQAGTTRDIKKRVTKIFTKQVEILDTGGLDEGNDLFDKIKEFSIRAAKEADIILYMVDGKSLPEDDDKKLFYELEAMGKDMALVVNKIDNDKMKEKIWEYYEFGCEDIFGISVAHNRSITPLLNWIEEKLPEEDVVKEVEVVKDELPEEEYAWDEPEYDENDNYIITGEEENEAGTSIYDENDEVREYDELDQNHLKVAIIGRVNVGKSSLLNAILNEDRSIVSPMAGTTIDPIDEMVQYKDKAITFVDTAGIRKRGKILGIEKFALIRTKEMLDKANIALIVLDASQPFNDLDEKISGLVDQNRLACLIVLNKWDLVDGKDYEKKIEEVRSRFRFLHYAEILTISALTKQRVQKIYDILLQMNENYSQRITTSKLNDVINWAQRKHHLPSMHGQVIKIYYCTQYAVRPPQIAIIMNSPKGLHFTYRRYLTNQLREAFDFRGVPLLFKAKKRGK